MNPIEQEVREMLRSKASQAPVRDEPPPIVLRRSRTLRVVNAIGATAAAAAVVIGVVFGVQSLGDRTTPTPPVAPAGQVVPWLPLPKSRSDAVVDLKAPGGRPCTADDVTLVVARWGIGFDPNRKDVSCNVDPTADGFKVVLRDIVVARPPLPVSIVVAETAPRVGVDGTKASTAGLFFAWSNYCGPITRGREVRFDVTLPGGGTIASTGGGLLPRCERPTDTSTLTFEAAGIVGALFSDMAPTVDNLGIGIDAPPTVGRGTTLTYRVSIDNPLVQDVVLGRCAVDVSPFTCPSDVDLVCPNYAEGFQRGDFDRVFDGNRMNCEGLVGGTIPAGGRVEFEMQLQVPIDLEPGEWTLFWAPEFGPRIDTAATANIVVL